MFDYLLNALVTLLVTDRPDRPGAGLRGADHRHGRQRPPPDRDSRLDRLPPACSSPSRWSASRSSASSASRWPRSASPAGCCCSPSPSRWFSACAWSARPATAHDAANRDDNSHVAVFPLAIPLISGPGAISATILLASRAPSAWATCCCWSSSLLMVGACLAVFLVANRAEQLLGETGRIVVSRLLGLLLAALSVQFVADGIMAFVHGNGRRSGAARAGQTGDRPRTGSRRRAPRRAKRRPSGRAG